MKSPHSFLVEGQRTPIEEASSCALCKTFSVLKFKFTFQKFSCCFSTLHLQYFLF